MSNIDSQGNKDETRSNAIKNWERSRSNCDDEDRRNHHSRSIYENIVLNTSQK